MHHLASQFSSASALPFHTNFSMDPDPDVNDLANSCSIQPSGKLSHSSVPPSLKLLSFLCNPTALACAPTAGLSHVTLVHV